MATLYDKRWNRRWCRGFSAPRKRLKVKTLMTLPKRR
ncbi:uncharacterized protein G2W53_026212 [Senna tora]|uniref:Uncharacterized protein n=1 Tax=Senna tora TaxID=362788 RepID=A0A834TGI5_9FABA|nr:uncharacterized protein G2W53_026212 [Senna tora]